MSPLPFLRWDIYWVDVPQDHTVGSEQHTERDTPRAWVIVSHPRVQARREIVIGVPLSFSAKQEDFQQARVVLDQSDVEVKDTPQIKLRLPLVALTEQVRVLAVERLQGGAPIGTVTNKDKAAEIENGLAYVLKLPTGA